MTRRKRTHQLIVLGGLIAKSGLDDLTDDDRAVMLGLLDEAAAKLRSEDRNRLLQLWRRRENVHSTVTATIGAGSVDRPTQV